MIHSARGKRTLTGELRLAINVDRMRPILLAIRGAGLPVEHVVRAEMDDDGSNRRGCPADRTGREAVHRENKVPLSLRVVHTCVARGVHHESGP